MRTDLQIRGLCIWINTGLVESFRSNDAHAINGVCVSSLKTNRGQGKKRPTTRSKKISKTCKVISCSGLMTTGTGQFRQNIALTEVGRFARFQPRPIALNLGKPGLLRRKKCSAQSTTLRRILATTVGCRDSRHCVLGVRGDVWPRSESKSRANTLNFGCLLQACRDAVARIVIGLDDKGWFRESVTMFCDPTQPVVCVMLMKCFPAHSSKDEGQIPIRKAGGMIILFARDGWSAGCFCRVWRERVAGQRWQFFGPSEKPYEERMGVDVKN